MKIIFKFRVRLEDNTVFKPVMTEQMAQEIKQLREIDHYSWRALATQMSIRYPDFDIIDGNQIEGMHLCRSAGAYLGETNWD